LRRWLFLILLGATGAYGVRRFAFEGIYLASDSMAPVLPEGRHVMVNKAAFVFSHPRRGDVVMFEFASDTSKGHVKRIIGIGGDRLEIRRKQVFLNGSRLEEPYVQHTRADEILKGDNVPEITIPEGHVFLMGDNRDVSGDSRDWHNKEGEWTPFLPVEQIRGLVLRT
jgi:signal peptidase I